MGFHFFIFHKKSRNMATYDKGGYRSLGDLIGILHRAQNKPSECGRHRWESPSELNIKSYWIYRRELIVCQLNSIPRIKQMKQRSSILVFPKCFHLILQRVLGRNRLLWNSEITILWRHILTKIITVRKRSCGKVMFSQSCVKNSVHGGW